MEVIEESRLPPLKDKPQNNGRKNFTVMDSSTSDEPSKFGRPGSIEPAKKFMIKRNEHKLLSKDRINHTLEDIRVNNSSEEEDSIINTTFDFPNIKTLESKTEKYKRGNAPRTFSEYKIVPNYDSNEIVNFFPLLTSDGWNIKDILG